MYKQLRGIQDEADTHTPHSRARDCDAETPYKNCSTDLASDTHDVTSLYGMSLSLHTITYIPPSRVHNENANETTGNHICIPISLAACDVRALPLSLQSEVNLTDFSLT